MIKEIKYSGYSASPSDYESPDGELAAAVNLIPEDGALHPVLPSKEVMEVPEGYSLLFLHHPSADVKNYILYDNSTRKLAYTTGGENVIVVDINTLPVGTELYHINGIGNTLLAVTNNGIYYYLWKEGQYKALGNVIPDVSLSFGLQSEGISYSDELSLSSNWSRYKDDKEDFSTEDKLAWNNMLLGAINKLIAEQCTNKGQFCMPFFVRYALRLYDGETLTHHSAPILMLPGGLYASLKSNGKVEVSIQPCKLDYVATSSVSALINWSDIVKSVDVFVSSPIWTYDQSGEVTNLYGKHPSMMSIFNPHQWYIIYNAGQCGQSGGNNTIAMPGHDRATIETQICECGNFYFLKSIPIEDLNKTSNTNFVSNPPTREVIDVGNEYLQSLTSREVMSDDYQTFDILFPRATYIYNGRLNIANIKRRLYDGYNPLSVFTYHEIEATNEPNPSAVAVYPVSIYVEIERDKKIVVQKYAKVELSSSNLFLPFLSKGCLYFFYPDPQAKRAILQLGANYYELPLKPHTILNGSYFFSMSGPSLYTGTLPTVTNDRDINMPNKIYTSEVNNPFFFPLLGINTVGTGEIMGICAAVKPLSQGQAGQFPLYVFTTEGVWALSTNAEGKFVANTPATLDVCINSDSITQTEDSVLFATDRGIMIITGNHAVCITDVLDGKGADVFGELPSGHVAAIKNKAEALGLVSGSLNFVPFKTYVASAKLIYDYTHQRIILFNPNTSYNYAYVFSLESKAWGMMATNLVDSLNSYPNALAVDSDRHLLDMCQEVTEVEVSTPSAAPSTTTDETEEAEEATTTTTMVPVTVPAVLVTRPLKLELPEILKTVDRVIQRGRLNIHASGHVPVQSILYGSRDLYQWHMVKSSTDHQLRGFRGTPYKYFKIVLLCNLLPDESLYGASVSLEARYTNRPR